MKEIKSNCRTFQYTTKINGIIENEPELIHVIKTGFKDKYMVVYEDAYELDLGEVEFGTKKEIESKFNIIL
jgi:hypothetical protein